MTQGAGCRKVGSPRGGDDAEVPSKSSMCLICSTHEQSNTKTKLE
jgi:hypothetical protein